MADGSVRGAAHALIWCASVLAATVCAPRAYAQPLVRVRAGTQVVLTGAQGEHGFDLQGQLLDDLGAPLPERALRLEIRAEGAERAVQQLSTRSATDGSFRVSAPLSLGVYRVRVSFAGDSHHGASESARVLDSTKADVQLGFIEPRSLRLDLDAREHRVALRASSAHGGGGLLLVLRDERGTSLARGHTDGSGLFRVALAATALGAPGSGKLIASTAGDDLRAPASAEIAVLRWRGSAIELRARADAESGRLALEGRLHDSRSGLAHKAVGLFEGDTHLATVLTDDAGRFVHHHPLERPAPSVPQALTLQARFDSDATWIGSCRSSLVRLTLQPKPLPSQLWLLVPLSLCALIAWLLLRRPARSSDSAPRSAAGIGIHPARRLARGRAAQRQFGGRVRDAGSDRPVRGATLALRAGDGREVGLTTDAAGLFQSAELPDAAWTLTVSAPGYSPLAAELAIPHRGEWADVQVQLQSLRAAAVQAYKPAALRVLPSAELWARWTARETLESALRNGRASEPFIRLTEHVELAAYARTPPSADDVAQIELSAEEALARFPADPSQPGGSGLVRAPVRHRR